MSPIVIFKSNKIAIFQSERQGHVDSQDLFFVEQIMSFQQLFFHIRVESFPLDVLVKIRFSKNTPFLLMFITTIQFSCQFLQHPV